MYTRGTNFGANEIKRPFKVTKSPTSLLDVTASLVRFAVVVESERAPSMLLVSKTEGQGTRYSCRRIIWLLCRSISRPLAQTTHGRLCLRGMLSVSRIKGQAPLRRTARNPTRFIIREMALSDQFIQS